MGAKEREVIMSNYNSNRKKNRKKIRYKRHGWGYIKTFLDIFPEQKIKEVTNYLKYKETNPIILGENLFVHEKREINLEWISCVER